MLSTVVTTFCSKVRFLNLGTVDILGQITLLQAVLCIVARFATFLPTKQVGITFPPVVMTMTKSPDIATYPLWNKITPY